MVMVDTNITDQVYCRNRLVYDVVCFPEIVRDSGREQGGVVLVVQDRPKGWSVKSTCFHRRNMVSFKVVVGIKQTPLIGVYLPHYTLDHLPELEKSQTRLKDQDPMVLGEPNVDIDQAHNLRS